MAAALALQWAAIVLAPFEGDDRGIVLALRDRGQRIGALVLPRAVPELTLRLTSDRIVPGLERLLAAALERRRLRRSDARGRVFEAFQQEGSDPTGHAGSGLGLAIARGFVEANGGRIAIESTAGGGATFVVQLPLPTPELERTPLPAAG